MDKKIEDFHIYSNVCSQRGNVYFTYDDGYIYYHNKIP